MKVILMNKNTPVLQAELDENNNFTQIYECFNKEYAPLSIYNAYNNKSKSPLKTLNTWFLGRGIPEWRDDLSSLLEILNVESSKELLNKSYGLSLSDQYWLKPDNEKIEWKDINFFQHSFRYSEYRDASINGDSSLKNISLKSPNNTTDGMVKKAWIIEDGKRVLIKSSYSSFRQEPINEWLASKICNKLGIYHCDYKVDILNNKIVSKCENFLNDNEEIISACDIFDLKLKDNNTSDYEHYISILEENGIKDARKMMSDMYIVDYLMMNNDRHLKNYGVIRNVETLKWEKVTPIFDTGESLKCDMLTPELSFNDEVYKFFSNTKYSLNQLVKYIDLCSYDLKELDDLGEDLKKQLKKYQVIMEISDERIDKLVNGFEQRIELLQDLQKEQCDNIEI